jgi:type I restriction enzyme M protein
LSREFYQRYRDKQDVRAGDILFVRDGTYLIGTCALVTQHDTEIVYQSHLYKIRVRDNDFGLDPFLLLAIVSSDVVQAQIKSKRFTQDIIDSLGDRILDLVLPIPKSAKRRAEISNMVRKVIADRAEARELSRLARRRVVET